MRRFLVALVIPFLLSSSVLANDEAEIDTHVAVLDIDPSVQQLESLQKYQQETKLLAGLRDRRILTDEQFTAAKAATLADVSKVMGKDLTDSEINAIVARNNQSALTGLFTFVNIVKFISAVLMIIALGWLLRNIIFELPPELFEVSLWGLCFLGLASKHIWPKTEMWMVLPSAIGLLGCLSLSYALHFKHEAKTRTLGQVFSAICALIWGFIAIQYQSETLGFMSVMALESFLGFSVLVTPLCIGLGFEEDDALPRAMTASFLLLVTYVGCEITHTPLKALVYFKTGALFMGAFVYYLSCLIISSKHYTKSGYLFYQFITIISGIAAFYFGAQFHIPTLLGIGGTFFVIYLLMKYYEIPWSEIGWAWSLLGLSIGLYGLSYFAWNHPQYFLWGITAD